MPYIDVNGAVLYYRLDTAAGPQAPWLVLSNALGTDVSLWAPQIDALARGFRLLRYDTRGHGRSSVPPGRYTIGQLRDDVVALMDALAIERAHFCGVSMGGVTGLELAAQSGGRIGRLVAVSAPPRNPTPPRVWAERIALARGGGMPTIAEATIGRWFSASFVAREPLVCAGVRDVLRHMDPDGYSANCEAIAAADLSAQVERITAPCLIVTGTRDAAISVDEGHALAARIEGARHIAFDALHMPNIEQAEAFTRAVLDFLGAR